MTVGDIDLTQRRMFFELGIPQVSPNILKHYPSSDYLRFTYEIYQIPPLDELQKIVEPAGSIGSETEINQRKRAQEEHVRAMQYFCKIAEYTLADSHSENQRTDFAKPLMTTSIIYKKGNLDRRQLQAKKNRSLQSRSLNEAVREKFKPEYFLQSNFDVTNGKVDFKHPKSDQPLEFNSASYTITNHLDLSQIFVRSLLAKDQLVKLDIKTLEKKS